MITAYQRPTSNIFKATSIVGITLYLASVGCWLVLRKKIIPRTSLWRLFKASLRPRHHGTLEGAAHEQGFCFKAPVPSHLISDKEGWSRIILYENGNVLPRAHSSHIDIRTSGNGSYSHWGDTLYFSTSDNSDPQTNGRIYKVSEELAG